jgi:hypothetical protein
MDLHATHSVELSASDLGLLRAGLRAYLREFGQHRQLDDGATHPEEQWQRLQRDVGQLVRRLEEVGRALGTMLIHSEEAVAPDDLAR